MSETSQKTTELFELADELLERSEEIRNRDRPLNRDGKIEQTRKGQARGLEQASEMVRERALSMEESD